jgi:energy-coupling factor transporter transmembrane protein EcfT
MAVLPALRITVSLNMTLALVMNTPASALSRTIAALRPPDAVFVPVSVALRFVGVFVAELTQVREAAVARTGRPLRVTALTRPWRLWRAVMAPMAFRALASSDSLALALEMKGVRSRALFWRRPPLLPPGDRWRLALGLIALALCLAAQYRDALAGIAARLAGIITGAAAGGVAGAVLRLVGAAAPGLAA